MAPLSCKIGLAGGFCRYPDCDCSPPQRRKADDLGRPLTELEKLENLDYAMMHCMDCEKPVEWGAPVCEHCGCELAQFGKN